jgi:hypothetical protein
VLKAGVKGHRCPTTHVELVQITLWRLGTPTRRSHGALSWPLRLIHENVKRILCRTDYRLIRSIDRGGRR